LAGKCHFETILSHILKLNPRLRIAQRDRDHVVRERGDLIRFWVTQLARETEDFKQCRWDLFKGCYLAEWLPTSS
jgi:hypothetical protein